MNSSTKQLSKNAICNGCSFILHFNEVPEELVGKKVDAIITKDYEDESLGHPNIREALADETLRLETRDFIEAHFPFCF